MGRVEDVTLPARFITTAAHLIATLTIVYDSVRAPSLARRPHRDPAPRQELFKRLTGPLTSSTERDGEARAGLEPVRLQHRADFFGGHGVHLHLLLLRRVPRHVHRRVPVHALGERVYIFAHFFGALFTGLFVTLQWDLQAYPWMFTLFSFFPAFTESVIAFLVLRLNIMQFK